MPAEVCPLGARKFGNILDADSEIRYIIEHKRGLVLKEELNTFPRFFYSYAGTAAGRSGRPAPLLYWTDSMLRAALLLLPVVLYGQTKPVVDNATVRILNALDRPHTPTPLHKHDFNRVMIYLDNGDQDITIDGKVEHHHWKAGEVAWSPVGPMHVSENVGPADLRIVEIELKKPAPATPARRNRNLDPLEVDRGRNTLVFENAQVRVFRSKLGVDSREKWHEHAGAGRAVVLLTPVAARVEVANSEASPMNGGPGDVFWRDGPVKQHRGTNLGSRECEMVIVEVK